MPAGKGKPAGGYRAGAKGSYGCEGYPTVSADGTVHGCHPTKAQAAAQARAIWASVAKKSMPQLEKSLITEGDFVMFICEEDEIKVGRVEYVMRSPGVMGLPGSEYALEYAENDQPMIIRLFEEEDGAWEEEEKLVYHRMSEVVKIESLSVAVDLVVEMGSSGSGIPEADSDMLMAMYDAQVGKSNSGYRVDPFNALNKRERSTATRERMADAGTAMPDGSFPIANATDLRNAIQSVGRAKDYEKAKQHIIRRARALNLINELPDSWKNSASKGLTSWGGSIFDIDPLVK